MQRKGLDSIPGPAGARELTGLSGRSSGRGGSGCWGNMEVGIPPGNTGKLVGGRGEVKGRGPKSVDIATWCPWRLTGLEIDGGGGGGRG